jgi:hypothetical protein
MFKKEDLNNEKNNLNKFNRVKVEQRAYPQGYNTHSRISLSNCFTISLLRDENKKNDKIGMIQLKN